MVILYLLGISGGHALYDITALQYTDDRNIDMQQMKFSRLSTSIKRSHLKYNETKRWLAAGAKLASGYVDGFAVYYSERVQNMQRYN